MEGVVGAQVDYVYGGTELEFNHASEDLKIDWMDTDEDDVELRTGSRKARLHKTMRN